MHTKNLPVVTISHCPLSSKFTFSKSTPYIKRCLEIIESARITWGYYSDEYKSCCYEIVDGEEVSKKFPPYSTLKLTSARSIQSWYTEHSDLILTSQKTPEAIKKAVQDVRRYTRPGIESSITDKEILAIFAICEAFDAVYKIQRGETEDAIKEKVLTASTFLELARTVLELEKQNKPNNKETKQIRNSGKASFDKVNWTITIDGKPFIFKNTKEYQLFEFLYENQSRRLKKDEIKKKLGMGNGAEQQVFNRIANLRKIIKTSSYEIKNKKEYEDRGGYLLILKK